MSPRRATADELRELLTPAIGENRVVRADALIEAGVPHERARSIARQSRHLADSADVDDVVADYGIELDRLDEESKVRDPAELAKNVPRGW